MDTDKSNELLQKILDKLDGIDAAMMLIQGEVATIADKLKKERA
ncbi:hypothetical protein [Arthrobacter sp. UYEF21]